MLPGIRSRRAAFALLALSALATVPAMAAEPGPQGPPIGQFHEQPYLIPWDPEAGAGGLMLEATVYRPDGNGPWPLAIVSHGSPRDAAQRPTMHATYRTASQWLVYQGYAVVVPMRRGYGNSGGGWAENPGPCANSNYFNAGIASSQDLAVVIAYMRRQSFVDPKRIVLIGHSAGGWASLAAASRGLDGVIGVVNFAGGRGSQRPDEVCRPDRLIDAVKSYGATTRVPTLWIYAENDHFFNPTLARQMFDTYVAAGAPRAEFFRAPATGKDGHNFFNEASGTWEPPVGAFLRKIGATR